VRPGEKAALEGLRILLYVLHRGLLEKALQQCPDAQDGEELLLACARLVPAGVNLLDLYPDPTALQLSAGEPQRQLAVPDAFPDGSGKIPVNPVIKSCFEAIWAGGPRARQLVNGWTESEARRPVYIQRAGKKGRIVLYPSPATGPFAPLPATDALWAYVEKLNAFTADVALAVLAQLVEPGQGDRPKYPLLEPVRITANAILAYKGIQRYGAERRLLQEKIFEEMRNLQHLHFDAEKLPGYDPDSGRYNPQGGSWKGDRLFDIVEVENYQEDLFGNRETIEVSWRVRAGQWARWFLNTRGRVWIGRMARVLLEMDNRGAALLAKKIGQRIALLEGAARCNLLELRIDTLLASIGELPTPEARDKNWAGRTRDRFDTALQSLVDHGIFTEVLWPEGYGPDDPDRSKGWPERWLAAKVQIRLPEDPPVILDPPKARALAELPKLKPNPALEAQRIDGQALQRLRKAANLTQAALAQKLGITREHLSRIEAQKLLPSRKLAARLRAWMKEAGLAV
jgi:DNA-binding XRE family transcriptional regulator